MDNPPLWRWAKAITYTTVAMLLIRIVPEDPHGVFVSVRLTVIMGLLGLATYEAVTAASKEQHR